MKRKMTAAEQSAEFKRMAQELGIDESPEAFDATVKRIVPGEPAPMPLPKKKAARKKKNRPVGPMMAFSRWFAK